MQFPWFKLNLLNIHNMVCDDFWFQNGSSSFQRSPGFCVTSSACVSGVALCCPDSPAAGRVAVLRQTPGLRPSVALWGGVPWLPGVQDSPRLEIIAINIWCNISRNIYNGMVTQWYHWQIISQWTISSISQRTISRYVRYMSMKWYTSHMCVCV